MLILEIALGIVLGVVLLGLIFSEAFWQIVGIILLGIVGIIILVAIWENFSEILGFLAILLVCAIIYSPVYFLVRYLDARHFRNFQIIMYPNQKKAIIKNNKEKLGEYNLLAQLPIQEFENIVFRDNKLKREKYTAQLVEQDETKVVWQYTKKPR